MEGRVDPASGLLLAEGCRPWDGTARRELFLRTNAPVTACPNQGEPQFYEATLDSEVPDYEEGLRMGLAVEQIAEQEEPAPDQPRFYTPDAPETVPVEPIAVPIGVVQEPAPDQPRFYTPAPPEPATAPSPPPG